MADVALSQEKFWLDGYDISGDIKGFDFQVMKEALDNSVFGNTTRQRTGGLWDVNLALNGFWDTAEEGIDKILFNRIGVENKPFSIGTPTGAAGDVGFGFACQFGEYAPGGEVGQLLEFSASAQASGGAPPTRGLILLNSTALTASGNGTKFQLGAVAAGKTLWANLHVLAAGTGTFDGVLQSDADSSGGGETNRITFTQATTISSQRLSVAGPITDTWWRLNYTIGGGAPSFNVILQAGII